MQPILTAKKSETSPAETLIQSLVGSDKFNAEEYIIYTERQEFNTVIQLKAIHPVDKKWGIVKPLRTSN